MRQALRNVPLALYFSAAFAFLDRAFTVLGIHSLWLGYVFLGLASLLAVVGLVQAASRLQSWYTNLVAERGRLRTELRQTGQELERLGAENERVRAKLSEADEERCALRAERDGLMAQLSAAIAPSGGTAAYPLLKREELAETHIKRRTVYIADFAREAADLSWADAVIKNRIFEECYIVGPAVLVPMNTGDLTGHVFVGDDQRWEEGGHAFWAPTADLLKLTGIVGLEDCLFRNCRYRRVGVLMSEEELRQRRREADEQGTELTDQLSNEGENAHS